MSAYLKVENKLMTCPFDEAHKVKESRLQLHIAKCKLNHLDKPLDTCPFNATHMFVRSERDFHLLNCADKAPLDRKMAQSLDKNNPFRGLTAVPSYTESQRTYTDGESWDEEISDYGPGYVPRGPPPGAIIEPRPMAKPAERRLLYKELHRMQTEPETVSEGSSVKSSPVPRQPMQPSETQRMQSIQQQQNISAAQNLGLGRARPPRIAANIFDRPQNVPGQSQNAASVNGVINGLGNLGLGRGEGAAARGFTPMLNDEDEFPALGCGRGNFRVPKQNPRHPGTKPAN